MNIELLAAQPGLDGVVITEIDESTIRVEIGDTFVTISGWNDDITIGGNAEYGDDLLEAILSSLEAVVFEC